MHVSGESERPNLFAIINTVYQIRCSLFKPPRIVSGGASADLVMTRARLVEVERNVGTDGGTSHFEGFRCREKDETVEMMYFGMCFGMG
jgi:hypothetical protein